jgi:hypothetical protein
LKNQIRLVLIILASLMVSIVTWGSIAHAKPDDSPQSDPQELVVAGQYGGYADAIFWNNDTTYVGIGPSLNIFDTTAPTTPTLLGRSLPLPGLVRDISVISTTAYVAVGTGGLSVLDVTDPVAPVKITQYIPEDGTSTNSLRNNPGEPAPLNPSACYDPGDVAYQVHAKGTQIFVAYGYLGLRILDMSDPSNPVEYGNLELYEGLETMAVYAKGRYAYVLDVDYEYGGSVLRVVDVSNPASPIVVGIKDRLASAEGVYAEGDYVYVAASDGLTILNVKDPTNPKIAGKTKTPGYARRVMVVDSLAFVADRHGGLRIIDVSDPATPKEIGSYGNDYSVYDLYILDDRAYLANSSGGLLLLDVSDPSQPKKLGSYQVLSSHYGLVVYEELTYLANGNQGLGIVDVTVPAQIYEKGRFQTEVPFEVRDISIDDNLVSIAGRRLTRAEHVMTLVDISDPLNPQEHGEYVSTEYIEDVHLAGGLAYVAASSAGLRVVDVSDPDNPQEISHLLTDNYLEAVDVVSDTVYTIDLVDGLRVIDASDPFNLTISGSYDPDYAISADVDVQGTTAYLALTLDGLHIVDVSDPTNPVKIGEYEPEGYSWSEWNVVRADGDRVYIIEHVYDVCVDSIMYSKLWVLNVSDPANPVELAYYQSPVVMTDLVIKGGLIYVTSRSAGFMILRYNDPAVFAHQVYFPMLLK